mgnify:CR=1 FL=1
MKKNRRKILSGSRKIFFAILAMFLSLSASAQQITASGQVLDAQKEPLIGVSVQEKGTSNGAITDLDGNFTLNVKQNAILIFSYVGYKSQEVKAVQQMKITLQEDNEVLDEVVVIGYGSVKRKDVTTAISSVSTKDLDMRPIVSAGQAIQGKAAGVSVIQPNGTPGGEMSIRVRGTPSMNGSNDPLYVVDGVPVDNIKFLSPNDIESISVLKDASSAAIYGSKASNGVILITTKRGKTGAPRISYNGYVGASKATSMIDRVSSADYARLWNRFEPGRYSDEDIRMFEDGSDPYGHPNTDWNDEAYRTGLLHKHNVSITGGAENVKYMASAGYLGQTGILPNSDRKQFNGRTNLDMQLTKKLAVRMNMSFIKNDFSDPNASSYGGSSDQIIRQLNIISPMIPVKDKDGKYGQTNDGNPIAWLDSGQTVDNCNQNFTGALSVDYDIIDGLKATVTGAYVNEDQRHTERVLSIPDDPASASRTTSLVERFVNWKRYNFDALLNYSKNFGQHGLKVMIGYHAEKYEVSKNQMQRNNFPSNSLNDMDAGGASTQTNDGLSRELAMLSYFGRINYDFAGKYLLEANFRADASSRFAPGHRWGYFPSVSAGWMISEENFMKGASKWLSMLKLRASYGQTGNSNVGYRIYDYYEVGRNAIIGGAESTGVYASDLGNKSITWETTTEFNLGVDFGIFNNRFKLAAEYFKRKITDLLVTNKPLPFYNEVNKIAGNIGSTQSQGVEITLNTVNIVTKDFEWDTTLTLSHYNDRWLKRDPNWKPRAYEKEDDPIRAWWEYEAIGILQPGEKAPDAQKDLVPGMMKLKDRDGNGVLGDEDKVYMGNGDPKIIYGLNNSFRYKNFDLNIYFYGEAGRKRGASYYEGWTRMDNGINVSTYALKAFSSNNLTATDPTYVRGGNGWGDYYVKSIYYVRCGSITLGYKVPISQKIVNNPFVITNWTGLDPETDNGTYAYPNVTSYNFGVSISF